MAIKLHKAGYEHALKLIAGGLEIEPDMGNWDDVRPTRDEIMHYLNTHSLNEYGLWFLGIDTDKAEHDSSRYLFPYGDLKVVHQSALLDAEEESIAKGFDDIEGAVNTLLDMIEEQTNYED